MVKITFPRYSILVPLIILAFLAGSFGCQNQPRPDPAATELARSATATPPAATPMPTGIATPTLAPTPTIQPTPIPADDFLPCDFGHYSSSKYIPFLKWTPDGSRLIFSENTSIFSISRNDNHKQWLIDANPLGFGPPFWHPLYADVSPDGSQIIYTSCTSHPQPYSRESREVSFEISIMNADGTGSEQLTQTSQFERVPVWSPVGNMIAYMSSPDQFDNLSLNIMDRDGLHTRTIFGSESDDGWLVPYPPVWSPDGERIAFITLDGGTTRRYLLNTVATDGSDHQVISETVSIASWSPDGARFPLLRRDGDDLALFTSADDGSDPQLMARIGEWHGYPGQWVMGELFDILAWSPDGANILYACDGLCQVNVDNGKTHTFFEAPETFRNVWDDRPKPNAIRAAWSPDSSMIAVYIPISLTQTQESPIFYVDAADLPDVQDQPAEASDTTSG